MAAAVEFGEGGYVHEGLFPQKNIKWLVTFSDFFYKTSNFSCAVEEEIELLEAIYFRELTVEGLRER